MSKWKTASYSLDQAAITALAKSRRRLKKQLGQKPSDSLLVRMALMHFAKVKP